MRAEKAENDPSVSSASALAASLPEDNSSAASRSRTVISSPAVSPICVPSTGTAPAGTRTVSAGSSCRAATKAVISFVVLAIGRAVCASFSYRKRPDCGSNTTADTDDTVGGAGSPCT